MFKHSCVASKTQSRRAVSEVISTLLLLVITIIGSVMISTFVGGSEVFNLGTSVNTIQNEGGVLKLVGYDTRDGTRVGNITLASSTTSLLDNKFDNNGDGKGELCTTTCNSSPNNVPTAGTPGTDFIVLRVRNLGAASVFVENVQVNGIAHTFDQDAINVNFDARSGSCSTSCPNAGQFSMISSSAVNDSPKQLGTNEIVGNQEVFMIIKLDTSVTGASGASNIALNKKLTVFVNTGDVGTQTFVIPSGDAR